jgi:hypothetical protein
MELSLALDGKTKAHIFLPLPHSLSSPTALELRPALVVEVEARKTGLLVREGEKIKQRGERIRS